MTTILLVDDNRSIREYCRQELEDEGYCVVIARDGREALKLIGPLRPDLVILDICMPEMDGLETVKRIRANQPHVPVVFFTSFDDVCARDERSRYATACVEKQADLTELRQVVKSALNACRQNHPYRLGLPPAILSRSPTQ